MSAVVLPMISQNPFIKPHEYVPEVDPVGEAINSSILFISRFHGVDHEKASRSLAKIIEQTGKNPLVECYKRRTNGDKYKTKMPLVEYIKEAYRLNETMVPSLTRYAPSKEDGGVDSLHKNFTLSNLSNRSKAKKGAATAYANGDMFLANTLTNKQLVLKLLNNAMSGAFASPGTVHYNPSAHYTLTSITRSVASIGNVVTEMVSGGNRFYDTFERIMEHITITINDIKHDDFENVVKQYELHRVTPQETLDIINYSSDLYFKSDNYNNILLKFLSNLTDIERCMIAYNNDLFHLHKYNPYFTNNMLKSISARKQGLVDVEEQVDYVSKQPEYIRNLVIHICIDELKGVELKPDKLYGTPALDIVSSTIYNIHVALEEYSPLMQELFGNRTLPPGVAYTKDMIRRVIILSDTDSTCGTYGHWVENVLGGPDYGPIGTAISATAMTIVGGAIENLINVFTGNMNVGSNSTGLLEMKNEYYWKTFAIGAGTKHYYAMVNVKEGFVFNEYKLELKGSQFIASKTPLRFRERRDAMIKDINLTVTTNQKVDVARHIREVLELEDDLYELINQGDSSMLESTTIKDASAYKNPGSSPFVHYGLWEDVFAPKYGHSEAPPYVAVKFNVAVKNKSGMKLYVESIEDKALAERFRKWQEKTGRKELTNILIPKDIVDMNGIPPEIKMVGNVSRLIINSLAPLYLVLATIGVRIKDGSTLTGMGYSLNDEKE